MRTVRYTPYVAESNFYTLQYDLATLLPFFILLVLSLSGTMDLHPKIPVYTNTHKSPAVFCILSSSIWPPEMQRLTCKFLDENIGKSQTTEIPVLITVEHYWSQTYRQNNTLPPQPSAFYVQAHFESNFPTLRGWHVA